MDYTAAASSCKILCKHYVVTTKSNPMKHKKLQTYVIDYSMIAHFYNSFRNQRIQIS